MRKLLTCILERKVIIEMHQKESVAERVGINYATAANGLILISEN